MCKNLYTPFGRRLNTGLNAQYRNYDVMRCRVRITFPTEQVTDKKHSYTEIRTYVMPRYCSAGLCQALRLGALPQLVLVNVGITSSSSIVFPILTRDMLLEGSICSPSTPARRLYDQTVQVFQKATYLFKYSQATHPSPLNPFTKLTGTNQCLHQPNCLPASPSNGIHSQNHAQSQRTFTAVLAHHNHVPFTTSLEQKKFLTNLFTTSSTKIPRTCTQKNPPTHNLTSHTLRPSPKCKGSGGTKPTCTHPLNPKALHNTIALLANPPSLSPR